METQSKYFFCSSWESYILFCKYNPLKNKILSFILHERLKGKELISIKVSESTLINHPWAIPLTVSVITKA